MSDEQLSTSIKYFLRHLEKEAERIQKLQEAQQPEDTIDFEEIGHFFRTLKAQNIFIFIVGINGKIESSPLSKLIFSLGKVVRFYYSLSLDSEQSGFIRIRLSEDERLILIERLHGYRPKPEKIYASKNPCHVIRFITRWMLRRIDWKKTRLQNLDIYKEYLHEKEDEKRKKQLEAQHEEGAMPAKNHSKDRRRRKRKKV